MSATDIATPVLEERDYQKFVALTQSPIDALFEAVKLGKKNHCLSDADADRLWKMIHTLRFEFPKVTHEEKQRVEFEKIKARDAATVGERDAVAGIIDYERFPSLEQCIWCGSFEGAHQGKSQYGNGGRFCVTAKTFTRDVPTNLDSPIARDGQLRSKRQIIEALGTDPNTWPDGVQISDVSISPKANVYTVLVKKRDVAPHQSDERGYTTAPPPLRLGDNPADAPCGFVQHFIIGGEPVLTTCGLRHRGGPGYMTCAPHDYVSAEQMRERFEKEGPMCAYVRKFDAHLFHGEQFFRCGIRHIGRTHRFGNDPAGSHTFVAPWQCPQHFRLLPWQPDAEVKNGYVSFPSYGTVAYDRCAYVLDGVKCDIPHRGEPDRGRFGKHEFVAPTIGMVVAESEKNVESTTEEIVTTGTISKSSDGRDLLACTQCLQYRYVPHQLKDCLETQKVLANHQREKALREASALYTRIEQIDEKLRIMERRDEVVTVAEQIVKRNQEDTQIKVALSTLDNSVVSLLASLTDELQKLSKRVASLEPKKVIRKRPTVKKAAAKGRTRR